LENVGIFLQYFTKIFFGLIAAVLKGRFGWDDGVFEIFDFGKDAISPQNPPHFPETY
jgi:hypothetical protein